MIGLLLLTACSFTMDAAIEKGDVVNVHGHIYNYENFKFFLKKIDEQENAKIRIITYTIEGDPIFYHLNYDGTSINVESDNSKDKYRGNGSTKAKITCSRMEATENDTKYFLKDCDKGFEHLIIFVSEIKD